MSSLTIVWHRQKEKDVLHVASNPNGAKWLKGEVDYLEINKEDFWYILIPKVLRVSYP